VKGKMTIECSLDGYHRAASHVPAEWRVCVPAKVMGLGTPVAETMQAAACTTFNAVGLQELIIISHTTATSCRGVAWGSACLGHVGTLQSR
jgi:hypothetical protein